MARRRSKKKRGSGAAEAARRQATERSSAFERTSIDVPEGMELFKMDKEGRKVLELIPFEAGEGNPFADPGQETCERTFYVHRGVGPNKDSYVCPLKTYGKRCPICEAREVMRKDEDYDEDLYDSLKPKQRQLFNVVDHDNLDKGVQLWDVSYYLFGNELNDAMTEDEDYYAFADPDDGYSLRCTVKEKSFGGHKYYEVTRVTFVDREIDMDDEWYEQAACLDELVKPIDYKELKKIFEAEPPDEDDDEEEEEEQEEKPRRRRGTRSKTSERKTRSRKTSDDSDDTSDKSEEEEQPRRRRRSKKTEEEPATAKQFGIEPGDLVEYEGLECTVVKVSRDGTSLTLKDEDGDTHRAVSPAEVTAMPDEDEEEEPPKRRRRRKPEREPEPEEDDDYEEDDDEEYEDESEEVDGDYEDDDYEIPF